VATPKKDTLETISTNLYLTASLLENIKVNEIYNGKLQNLIMRYYNNPKDVKDISWLINSEVKEPTLPDTILFLVGVAVRLVK